MRTGTMNEETWDAIRNAFYDLPEGGFMTPQLEPPQRLWRVEVSYHAAICDADEIADISKSTSIKAEFLGVLPRIRLSAPGYLDCTDWESIDSVKELREWADTFCDEQEER